MKKVLLLLLAGILSCEAQLEEEPAFVRTEDIVLVSGEKLILTGRILSGDVLNIIDHGFMIDSLEDFSDPLTLSLGERELPGRFVGETDKLMARTTYFARAFANIGGNTLYGQNVSFSTYALDLIDFQPRVALSKTRVTIRGSNFSRDTRVFFDDQPVNIFSIEEESIIQVETPPMRDKVSVSVRVESQGISEVFPYPFEYVIGTWNMAGIFSLNEACYSEVIAMENDSTLIFGLGARRDRQPLNEEIFSFNIAEGAWDYVPMLDGLPVMSGFAAWPFIGSGSYRRVPPFGTGALILSSDFWQFDGNRFNQLQELPFALYKSIALTLNGQLYVIGGQRFDRAAVATTYKYDPNLGTWQNLPSLPIPVTSEHPHFTYRQYLFVLAPNGRLYRLDTDTETWDTEGQFPARVGDKGIAEVIGDRVYLGLFGSSTLMWEYDLKDKRWRPKGKFTGDFREANVASWVWEDALFVLRTTRFAASPNMEIWQFNPENF